MLGIPKKLSLLDAMFSVGETLWSGGYFLGLFWAL